MQLQDLFDRLNALAYRNHSRRNYFYKLARFIVVKTANFFLPFYLKHTNYVSKEKIDVIVSLTSFPARIDNLWITITTLKRQTFKPEKILLWLSTEQFIKGFDSLPDSLKELIDEQFEVKFVKDDYKPHKKYYYAFKRYSDKVIITVDDDIFYNSHLIESLYKEHIKYPDSVICNRAVKIIKNKSYKYWPILKDYTGPSFDILPTGVAGVLYPPRCYDNRIFEVEIIKQTCLRADDLWLNFMCRLNGTSIIKTSQFVAPLVIDSSQKVALCKRNNGEFNENDFQISKISQWSIKNIGVDFYYNKKSEK